MATSSTTPQAETKAPKTQPCECGCGTTTKRRFAPGHDMRVGPRADGKVAGEKAARTAMQTGKLAAPKLPTDSNERALFIAGYANGLRLGLAS
jgi:hypothetical protein